MTELEALAHSIGAITAMTDEAGSGAAEAAQAAETVTDAAEALGAQSVADLAAQVKSDLELLAQTLDALSQRSTDIQAQVVELSDRGAGTTGPGILVPGSSPAQVPTVSGPQRKSSRTTPRSRLRKFAARAIKLGEDTGDAVNFGKDAVQRIDQGIIKAPEPPSVTATSTRSPSSPPVISSAPNSGIDAGNVATAGLAIGIFIAGSREYAHRLRRKLDAAEPEEPSR